MKIQDLAITCILALTVAGCSSGATLGNISIPNGAKNISTNEIGKNTQLVYLADGNLNDACDAQTKLITAANWKPTEEPGMETTYVRSSFSDGKSELTLMCSEEREGDTLVGVKITMTLMASVQ